MKKICAIAACLALAIPATAMAKDLPLAQYDARQAKNFAKMDGNKDGQLSREELAKAFSGQKTAEKRIRHHFKNGDTNGDSQLSQEEYMNFKRIWFNDTDSNGDGVLSDAERNAAQ